ncbi:hypothetical protein [Marinicella marina]|uniref:hypothetical protein n=1 Tax=Marinicella marina TaxID=2996016 RepID=UPI002260F3E6|nr:hypothetical protein [Marinicella marina]
MFLFLTACTVKKQQVKSELCPLLKNFANSIPVGETKQIVLETCWECENSLLWKKCESFEYEPAQAVCAYFLEYARTERPQYNLDKTIACLAEEDREPVKNAWIVMHDVELVFSSVNGVQDDVGISLEFDDAKHQGVPTLIISAQHFNENWPDE